MWGPYLGGNLWGYYGGMDINGDGLGDTEISYNAYGGIQNGGDYLPLTNVNVACGGILSSAAPVVLEKDLYCPDQDGIVIGRNYVSLDCNGHKITGSGLEKDTTGIRAEGKGAIHIKNCVIKNFGTGIELKNVTYAQVNNNTVTDNKNGIHLKGSSKNHLYDNIAEKGISGFIIERNSDENNLSDNLALNCGYGYYVDRSRDNTILRNTGLNTVYGFHVQSADHNIFTNNIAESSISGFFIGGSSENIFKSNIINASGDGFHIASSDKNNFTSNEVYNNDIGFSIGAASDGNLIYNNLFFNEVNVEDYGTNIWNIAKTVGTNIVGGPYIGGNFWSDYAGKDTDGDFLGNTLLPYDSNGKISSGGDYLLLVRCGDGVLDPEEECDDGNNIDGKQHHLQAPMRWEGLRGREAVP